MKRDPAHDALVSRLEAALRENRRLRADTDHLIAQSRAWSDTVARNIRDAPRWAWTFESGSTDSHARWPASRPPTDR